MGLSMAHALSESAEVHFLVEVPPELSRTSLFDVELGERCSGLISAVPIFEKAFPANIGKYWANFSSMNLVTFHHQKSVDVRTLLAASTVLKFIKSVNPDVVHFDDLSLRSLPVVWGLRGFPRVANIHDPMPHSGESNWRGIAERRLMLKSFDKIILHSNYSKKVFTKAAHFASDKVATVHFGVSDMYNGWVKRSVNEEKTTVLFLGRLSKYKGVDVLLDAARIISTRLHGCKFVIAGRCVPGYVLPEIPSLPNDCIVKVTDGYVSNSEMAELMQKATVVVCPYLDATQSAVVLAAYGFVKPVIGTSVGGLPEYIFHQQSGLVIPPNDAQALADSIIELLSNKPKRESMKSFIQNDLRKILSWEKAAQKTLEIYRSLL